jgi:hypothetical protein
VATILTVGAGAAMLVIDVSRYGMDLWFGSGFGIGITIGAVAAMVSFLLGPLLIIPMSNRIEKIATGEANAEPAELNRLTSRLRRTLGFDSALLFIAVIFMAGARYL